MLRVFVWERKSMFHILISAEYPNQLCIHIEMDIKLIGECNFGVSEYLRQGTQVNSRPDAVGGEDAEEGAEAKCPQRNKGEIGVIVELVTCVMIHKGRNERGSCTES